MSKVLLLGGTGAIGVYLAPELIKSGHDVFITSRSSKKSNIDKLSYIRGDARNNLFLSKLLENKYDSIIDFMTYGTDEFRERHEFLLSNTTHYIFISSCAVFSESCEPITETSPRLLDVLDDPVCLATDSYALAKARHENILRESQYNNWSIVRPTITYSKTRFDFGNFGESVFVVLSLHNRPIIFPQEMLLKQTTMTWGGDVAKMIVKLVLNRSAFCEDFNVCTTEYHSWSEVADYYKKLIGLNIVPTDFQNYLKIIGSKDKYRKLNTRLQNNRIMDNSKILKATNMSQEDLMNLFDGLSLELSNKKTLKSIKMNYILCVKMSKITNTSVPIKFFIIHNISIFRTRIINFVCRIFRKIF